MEIYKKVYVYCPPNVVTGGPETHHAVVDTINNAGGEAYIFYNNSKANVPPPYAKYNVRVADDIEDSADNLLIVCEMYTDMLDDYKYINKAIMFLSLEFYLSRNFRHRCNKFMKDYHLPNFVNVFIYIACKVTRRKLNYKKIDFNNPKLIISCNGAVNKNFLIQEEKVSAEKIRYICGPLNLEFLNPTTMPQKSNIIAYNPKKGLEFTNKIIKMYANSYNNASFVPIENMSAQEVHNLLRSAKVYIDFGNHPGPERIPREAVVSYCTILTSKNGSAKYYEDVPIDSKYKFDDIEDNLEQICTTISELITNYEFHINEFDFFREKILKQRDVFEKNVLDTFMYRS